VLAPQALRTRAVCGVANPRHSYGYGCGLRLASHPDPPRLLGRSTYSECPKQKVGSLLASVFAAAHLPQLHTARTLNITRRHVHNALKCLGFL